MEAAIPRPTLYSQALANRICARLAGGESMVDICGPRRAKGMPSARTVYVWLAQKEDFHRAYLKARRAQADRLFDEIVQIADGRDGEPGQPRDVRRDSLRVSARRWVVGKLAPKLYGEKVALIGGTDGNPPIRNQDDSTIAARIAAILEAARMRKAGAAE